MTSARALRLLMAPSTRLVAIFPVFRVELGFWLRLGAISRRVDGSAGGDMSKTLRVDLDHDRFVQGRAVHPPQPNHSARRR